MPFLTVLAICAIQYAYGVETFALGVNQMVNTSLVASLGPGLVLPMRGWGDLCESCVPSVALNRYTDIGSCERGAVNSCVPIFEMAFTWKL